MCGHRVLFRRAALRPHLSRRHHWRAARCVPRRWAPGHTRQGGAVGYRAVDILPKKPPKAPRTSVHCRADIGGRFPTLGKRIQMERSLCRGGSRCLWLRVMDWCGDAMAYLWAPLRGATRAARAVGVLRVARGGVPELALDSRVGCLCELVGVCTHVVDVSCSFARR